MIKVLVLLLLVAGGLALGPVAEGNKGYVLIIMGNTTVEMTVYSFTAMSAAAICFLLMIQWIVKKILRTTNSSFLWLSSRKHKRALQQTTDGLLAVAAQDWKSAEKLLAKSASHSQTPALNYLVAAEAAKKTGHEKKSQKYFEQVGDAGTQTLAIAMTKARLADDDESRKEALALLQSWYSKQPKNPSLLAQLADLYFRLEMWQEWLQLTPELRKYTKLEESFIAQREQTAHHHYFEFLASHKGPEATLSYWNALPKSTHANPMTLAGFSSAMRKHGGASEVSELIFQALCKSPEQCLLDEWFQLPVKDPELKLQQVKKSKIKESHERASLYGLTALHAHYFNEAIDHFKSALKRHHTKRDYLALASALEQSGQYNYAIDAYKKAVVCST